MEQTGHLLRHADVVPGWGYLPLFISRKPSGANTALRVLSGLSLSLETVLFILVYESRDVPCVSFLWGFCFMVLVLVLSFLVFSYCSGKLKPEHFKFEAAKLFFPIFDFKNLMYSKKKNQVNVLKWLFKPQNIQIGFRSILVSCRNYSDLTGATWGGLWTNKIMSDPISSAFGSFLSTFCHDMLQNK